MKSQIEEKINSLSIMEQNMQQIGTQKQNLQTQLVETESSLEEIEGTQEVYKIIGNIMVKSKKEKIKDELEDKKKMISIRISTIEKQEAKMHEKAQELQKELMKELEEEEKK